MAIEKSFGAQLKEAREMCGVSLDDIARTTRISRRYLQALEASDLESLPGSAFDKGYIRAYSEFLGIDPEPVLESYHLEERRLGRGPESAQRTIQEMSRLIDRGATTRTKRRAVLASSAMVLVSAAAVVWLSRSSDVNTEPAPSAGIESQAKRPTTPIPKRSTPQALASDQPSPPREQGLIVTDHGVGTGIVNQNLVGRTSRFSEGTDAWFWTRVVGGSSGESIRHLWFYDGRVVMQAELTVGGPHWRTFSRVNLPPGSTGRWSVEARAADGRVLGREEFECLPAGES